MKSPQNLFIFSKKALRLFLLTTIVLQFDYCVTPKKISPNTCRIIKELIEADSENFKPIVIDSSAKEYFPLEGNYYEFKVYKKYIKLYKKQEIEVYSKYDVFFENDNLPASFVYSNAEIVENGSDTITLRLYQTKLCNSCAKVNPKKCSPLCDSCLYRSSWDISIRGYACDSTIHSPLSETIENVSINCTSKN